MQLIIIPATAAMKIQAAERFNRQEIQPAKDPTSENIQPVKIPKQQRNPFFFVESSVVASLHHLAE